MHLFHNWKTVHRFTLKNKKGWFKHEKCACGSQRIKDHLDLSASQSDASELGFAISIYSGFQNKE